jgi:CHAT domain-containing protein/tetratricopeptide (TPR) repeat protein
MSSAATVESLEQMHAEVLRLVYSDVDSAARVADAARAAAQGLTDHRGRAFVHRCAGHVAYARSRYEEALSEYREAVRELELSGHDVDEARTRSGALQPLILLGRYEEATQWAARARSIFQCHGDELRLARLASNVGNIFYRQDRYQEALEQYGQAYEQFQRIGQPLDISAVLSNLAVCHISLSQYAEALDYYRQARAHAAAHSQSLLVAGADYNIAYLHFLRGDYLNAMELYRDSRAHCQKVGDAYHVALCDLDECEMCLEVNLNQEARHLARQATAAFAALRMPYEEAKSTANLALAESRLGETERALKGFRHARALFQRENNRLWPGLIDLYEAIVYRRLGRRESALRLSRRAQRRIPADWLPAKAVLARLLEAQLLLESGSVGRARELCLQTLSETTATVHSSLFHAWFLLGQIDEAREDWAGAYEACQAAVAEIEGMRSRLPGEELKISFLKDKLAVYESSVWLCLDHYSPGSRLENALMHIQRAKSRVLADQMANLDARSVSAADESSDLRDLTRQLHWHYRRIESEAGDGLNGAPARIRMLQQEAREQETRLAAKLTEERVGREMAMLDGESAVPVDQLCAAIGEDALLLEYFRVRDVFHVCLIGRRGLRTVRLCESRRVRQLLHLLRFQLSKFRLGPEYLKQFSPRLQAAVENHLRCLHEELIAPVRELLKASHLIVAPHSFLHHLPFHALLDGNRYLIDDFSISYAPSASVHALCAERPKTTARASLVFGVPDEGTPYVLEEVQSVAAQLPNARLLLGEEATAEMFRSKAPAARYLHVATHGVFRRDNPLFSSIRLGNSHLSLFDLYQLRLSAEMVTLSGCSTGLHSIEGGDELIGLVRGFLCAGAHSAVVSLWDVNDSTTACLMGAFYGEIRKGLNKAEALRSAMRSLRNDHPHPYHWAPFVVVGKHR